MKEKCESCGAEAVIIVEKESRVPHNVEYAIGRKEGEVTYIRREKVYICDACGQEQVRIKPASD